MRIRGQKEIRLVMSVFTMEDAESLSNGQIRITSRAIYNAVEPFVLWGCIYSSLMKYSQDVGLAFTVSSDKRVSYCDSKVLSRRSTCWNGCSKAFL